MICRRCTENVERRMQAETDANRFEHIAGDMTVRLMDTRQQYWKLFKENRELRRRLGITEDELVLAAGTH